MTDNTTLFDTLVTRLSELEALLAESKASMPTIETDIIKERLRNLYTHIGLLEQRTTETMPPMPRFVVEETSAKNSEETVSESVSTTTATETQQSTTPDEATVENVAQSKEKTEPQTNSEGAIAATSAVGAIATAEAVTIEETVIETTINETVAEETVAVNDEATVVETTVATTDETDTNNEKGDLFAPAEDEAPAEASLPPMMDKIESNPFGTLFDLVDEDGSNDNNETSIESTTVTDIDKTNEEPESVDKETTAESTTNAAVEQPAEIAQTETNDNIQPDNESKTENSLRDLLRHPIADTPSTKTIGEQLVNGNTVESQIATRVGHARVSDLRTVININDKFSFMSELFHGNMKAYNDFILHLNALQDRQEALSHVRHVAQENNWNMESLAVQTFYSILERKF